MNTSNRPDFASVSEVLRGLGSSTGAAEAHGSLSGLACILGEAASAQWLAELGAEMPAGVVPEEPLLAALASGTCSALEDGDLTFQPLLPSDEDGLDIRTASLARWCAGFNRGLAIGCGIGDAMAGLTTGVTGEIVQDLGELARADVAGDEHGAEGEAAYVELVEYVRVSVQLIFEELHPARSRLADRSAH